ncbi:MAG: hypothetical protein WAM13_12925, partial [Candidatus Sulfotelmatobacter sp.]
MRALLLVISVASVPLSRVMAVPGKDDGHAGQSAQGATLTPAAATAPDIPLGDYDSQAERQLLDLANQARAQAGAPRLTLDVGLS